jgi:hypothetical protein
MPASINIHKTMSETVPFAIPNFQLSEADHDAWVDALNASIDPEPAVHYEGVGLVMHAPPHEMSASDFTRYADVLDVALREELEGDPLRSAVDLWLLHRSIGSVSVRALSVVTRNPSVVQQALPYRARLLDVYHARAVIRANRTIHADAASAGYLHKFSWPKTADISYKS